MTKIVQISDTHFGTEVPDVVWALTRAIAQLAPDIVVLAGDITQRARQRQFQAAKDFMDSLDVPVKRVVPGNHDLPLFNVVARLFFPYRNFKRAFTARRFCWTDETICLLGMDATCRLRHTRGKLTLRNTRRFLRAHQAAMQDRLVILAAHQPLVLRLPQDLHNLLIHPHKTAKQFSEAGVDLVLSGHVHVPVIATTRLHYPELSHHFVVSGSGTACSHRVRDGFANSFNLLNVHDNRHVEVALWEYAAASGFTESSSHCYEKRENGWAEN